MNKKGKIAIEILIVLVIIAATSAVMLLLVKTGVIGVKESQADVLDSEFIPYTRGGSLAIKDFEFCGYVDEDYECIQKKDEFDLGNNVFFRFVVESSVYDRKVNLIENYRIKGPTGEVLLEVDSSDDFYSGLDSSKETEQITFRDYFTVGSDMPLGKYTLELLISNPLLNKNVKLVKEFEME